MKTPFTFNLQLFAEPSVNFEDILKKHAGEDGNIPADAISKAAQAISSAVGRAFVDKARYNAKLDDITQLEQEKNTAEDNATKAGKWEDKYNKEHEAFEKYKTDTEAKATLNAVKEAYKKLLTEANIDPKRHDAILRATTFDDKKLGADGALENADKLKEAIEKDWADFKVTTTTKGAKVETPPKNDGSTLTKADIYAKDEKGRYKMSTAERQRALVEHPELMKRSE